MVELKYKDIKEKIIRASFEVPKFLGNGLPAVIYKRALACGLKQGPAFTCEEVKIINTKNILIVILILFLLLLRSNLNAQKSMIDSLQLKLTSAKDTNRVSLLLRLSNAYNESGDYSNALTYKFEALQSAEAINDQQSIFVVLYDLADYYQQNGTEARAEQFAQRAEAIALAENDTTKLFEIYNLLGGIIYFNQGKYDESLVYGLRLMKIAEALDDPLKIAYVKSYLGDIYRVQGKYKEAIAVYEDALNTVVASGNREYEITFLNNIAVIYEDQNKNEIAISYYKMALAIAKSQNDERKIADYTERIAYDYMELDSQELAETAAKESLTLATKLNYTSVITQSLQLLERTSLSKNDFKNAYQFSKQYKQINDSINSTAKQAELASFQTKYEIDKRDHEIDLLQETNQLQSNIRTILIISSTLLFLGIILVGRQYRVANAALLKLKSTQSQLIQSEKMASLGELTAGIAHEIQNPLNFVNNFSDVNIELIEEMKKELAVGNRQLAEEIAEDIKSNEQKINHHGKRADGIVKGMLQHSRTSTGQKELTDINALCDEYLRLAYHGLRAKDKSFNAKFETHLDPSMPKLNVIAQDIGRVLLNLINNAFYAVSEKLKVESKKSNSGYDPAVTISTKQLGDKIEISVKDNGNGIPDSIKEKIFQPFFTTKPTGQGTGLGLSLSYDIVKAHGGELKVETQEGKFTSFFIQLPMK